MSPITVKEEVPDTNEQIAESLTVEPAEPAEPAESHMQASPPALTVMKVVKVYRKRKRNQPTGAASSALSNLKICPFDDARGLMNSLKLFGEYMPRTRGCSDLVNSFVSDSYLRGHSVVCDVPNAQATKMLGGLIRRIPPTTVEVVRGKTIVVDEQVTLPLRNKDREIPIHAYVVPMRGRIKIFLASNAGTRSYAAARQGENETGREQGEPVRVYSLFVDPHKVVQSLMLDK